MTFKQSDLYEGSVMDWGAAVWAGLLAGVAFLLTNLIVSSIAVDDADVTLRLMSSLILGNDVLLSEPTAVSIIVGLLVHFVLSVLFTVIIALLIHRWGLLVGIVAGGLLGLALYGINFFALRPILPQFFVVTGWTMAVSHLIFGAVAGGMYEALEDDDIPTAVRA